MLLLYFNLGLGDDDNLDGNITEHCCPASITLTANGAPAKKWSKYLGHYKATSETHEGTMVFQNQNGNYLYHHKKGQWRVNNIVNKRGVFKGVSSGGAECISPNSTWYFWDEEWRKGKIEIFCDQDSGTMEHGRVGSSFIVIEE